MKKKIFEKEQVLNSLRTEIQNLIDTNKVNEANEKMIEFRNIKNEIKMLRELDEDEEESLRKMAQKRSKGLASSSDSAKSLRAMIKKFSGNSLTEAENSLLLPTDSVQSGANGESYLLPKDIRTTVIKLLRDYSSLRDVVGYIPATSLTGQFAIEAAGVTSGLVDFSDGTPVDDANDIKFSNMSFSLKEKAAFIQLSNTLLSLSDEDLLAYVMEIFAKKAALTENNLIIAALKKSKVAKDYSSIAALKSGINKEIDPAALAGASILTNQDGFDFMDSQTDAIGRPLLMRDISNPTLLRFKGLPITVVSNTIMPSSGNKAPIFFGNLKEAVKVVDLGRLAFASSSHAGFYKNVTVARAIEFVDVVQADSSDKCYVYGTLDLTASPNPTVYTSNSIG